MSLKKQISFTINGEPVTTAIPVTMSALEMIRDTLNLSGTKYGCGEGECGACTILVDGLALNSCLMFAVNCDGRELLTIEGVADGTGLSPLQKAFVDNWATQCGFCTPGMIMQATYLLKENSQMSSDEIKRGIEGNLCRCTGYKKIVDAIQAAQASQETSLTDKS